MVRFFCSKFTGIYQRKQRQRRQIKDRRVMYDCNIYSMEIGERRLRTRDRRSIPDRRLALSGSRMS